MVASPNPFLLKDPKIGGKCTIDPTVALTDELTKQLFCLAVEDSIMNKACAWPVDLALFLNALIITEYQKTKGDSIF